MKKLLFTVLFFAHIQTIKTIDDSNINQSKNENFIQIKENISQENNTDIAKVIERPSVNKTSSRAFKIMKLGYLFLFFYSLFQIVQSYNDLLSVIHAIMKRKGIALAEFINVNNSKEKFHKFLLINSILSGILTVEFTKDFLCSLYNIRH